MHIWVIERVHDDGRIVPERGWEISKADAKRARDILMMWHPNCKYRIRKYVRVEE